MITTTEPPRTTAVGQCAGGTVSTVTDVTVYDTFTATGVRQGRVSATAFNSPSSMGATHFGVSAHGVATVDITDSLYGITLTVRTESGQVLSVDLYSIALTDDSDGDRQPIVVRDGRVSA